MAKVLIIGAGLGGLTLAHILHQNHVPFELFERDVTTESRKQGWAVALVECLPLLEKSLPPALAQNLYTNSVNRFTGEDDEIGFIDAVTGEKVGRMGGVPRGQRGHMLRVGRKNFRDFLLSPDLPVSMGKQFSHYTQEGGSVTAYFKDGSSSVGTLLVGADGVHSHVRDQLTNASPQKLTLSEFVPIFGEVNLPKDLYEPIRALGNAVILAGAPQVRQQIGMLHMNEDRSSASFFWSLMLKRKDPDSLSRWVQNSTSQEVYDFALQSTEGLHPVVKDLIHFGGPGAIAKPQPQFLEWVPPNTMPKGRVTVLGDAAHAMVPFRGAGANTAILDAGDLGQLVVEAWKQQVDFSGVLDTYHKLMVPRGKENVLSSRAAGYGDSNPAAEWAKLFQRKEAEHGGKD